MNKKEEETITAEEETLLKMVAITHSESIDVDYERYFDEHKAKSRNLEKILKNSTPRKKLFVTARAMVAMVLTLLLFVGAGFTVWNVLLKDHDTYTEIIKFSEYGEIEKTFTNIFSEIPDEYMIILVQQNGGYAEIIFEHQDNQLDKLIFSESKTVFNYDVDTEDTKSKEVTIGGRYFGYYIEKNDMRILIWEQDGLFYRIISTNQSIDLIKLASKLNKI